MDGTISWTSSKQCVCDKSEDILAICMVECVCLLSVYLRDARVVHVCKQLDVKFG